MSCWYWLKQHAQFDFAEFAHCHCIFCYFCCLLKTVTVTRLTCVIFADIHICHWWCGEMHAAKIATVIENKSFSVARNGETCNCFVSGLWVRWVLWDGWQARVNVVARLHVCMCSLPNWWTLHSEHSHWSHSPGVVITDTFTAHVLLIRQPARDSISNI